MNVNMAHLLGLLFSPEDASNMLLQNAGSLSVDCMTLYPKG
jgi:hypothetical protein